ncbi:hypothetical protein [Actinoplanes awajinensis]|uniref:Uncharacterized protein n=1 Tax=Actinoplanes awajinensis subsp. mycoplanecinus TaxID=135947 RepID=A0A0X3VDN3_9ACTN|nr:hypothetical protein [Actinoplanes awajinensis]KUL42517.1 hypothetical protein ADL15_01190 [Actinoplanes awajinensis subsp. mycoplanecinus]
MADVHSGDTTPAVGLTDPTRVPGSSDEPATGVLPSRWSGAAPVPKVGPRRSFWHRVADRISGEPQPVEDYWATVPAVDPWAGQDTPVWTTEHLTAPAPADMPPTRWDTPPVEPMPPTRIDAPTAASAPTAAAPGAAAPAARPSAEPVKVELPEKIRALVDALAAKAKAGQAAPTAVPPKSPAGPAPGSQPPPVSGSGPASAVRRGWFRKPTTAPAPSRVPVPPRPPVAARPAPPWSPPRPRRKRRRLRRLLLVVAVLAGLWFGAPLAYDRWPTLAQFPATAELPDRIGDLRLRIDDASQRAIERLAGQLDAADSIGDAFAGVYGDDSGKRVTVYGVTGWRFTPDSDVTSQLGRIAGDAKLTDVQDYPIDEFGAHESCGTGRLNGTSTVICTWADHGSMATVLLTRRSVAESAKLVARLRGEMLSPQFGA